MKRYSEGINPHTGEYFYREHKKPAPRKPEFELDFNQPLGRQLAGRVFPADESNIRELNRARQCLLIHGCLPGNRDRAVQKQITLKARRAISKYNKAKQHYESQNTNTPT